MGATSDNRKMIQAAMLFGVVGLALGSGGVTSPLLLFVGTAAASVFANLLTDGCKATADYLEQSRKDPTSVAHNFDVSLLAGQAIADIVRKAYDDFDKSRDGAGFLESGSRITADEYAACIELPQFGELHGEKLMHFVGVPHGGVTQKAAANSVWYAMLLAAYQRRTGDPTFVPPAGSLCDGLAFAAQRLWERFPAQFNGVLRGNKVHDGRAWIAVQSIMLRTLTACSTQHFASHQQVAAEFRAFSLWITGSTEAVSAQAARTLLAADGSLIEQLRELRTLAYTTLSRVDMRVRCVDEIRSLLVSGPKLRSLALPPGGEPGTLRGARRIDFILRDAEMGELRAFLNSPPQFAWQLWHGAAGMGKSRLGFELCRSVDHSWKGEPSEWLAGFLDLDRVTNRDWKLWRPDRPTLITVDYVQEHAEELQRFIEQLARDAAASSRPKVRVLLLERDTDPEWFNGLCGRDDGDGWRWDAAHKDSNGIPQPARELTPFAVADTARVVDAVLRAKTPRLPSADPPPPSQHALGIAAKVQSAAIEFRPLFAILATLAALDGKDPATMSHEVLAREWLGHEFRAWRGKFPKGPVGERDFQRHITLVATATLAQGLPTPGGYRALHTRLAECGAGDVMPPPDAFAANYDLLEKFYSLGRNDKAERIPALRPDYLGELLVLDHVQGELKAPAAQRAILRAALTLNPEGAMLFLRHAAQNHTAHPALRTLLERGLELCPPDGAAWPVSYGLGAVESSFAFCAGWLGLSEMQWTFFERAVASPAVRPSILLDIAGLSIQQARDPAAASSMLMRLGTMDDTSEHDLAEAASIAWSSLRDANLTRILLEKVRDHPQAGANALATAAGTAGRSLRDAGLTRSLLEKVRDHPQAGSHSLAEGAGTAWSSLQDAGLTRSLLEKVRDDPQAGTGALAMGAGTAWSTLRDAGLTRSLLEKVRDHPRAEAQSLAMAAGRAWGALQDAGLARSLLEKVRDHPHAGTEALVNAVGTAWSVLQDAGLAQTLLERAQEKDKSNAVSLAQVALWWWSITRREERSRKLFQAALDLRRAYPVVQAYRALFLLCAGCHREASPLIQRFLAILNTKEPSRFSASIWFAVYVANIQPQANEALARIHSGLASTSKFDVVLPLDLVLEHVLPVDHPERNWIEKLALVITDQANPSVLDGWERWRRAAPQHPT